MGKAAYPTQAELESLLTSAGVALGTLNTADAISAGIDDFESRVGRKMLAPAGTQVRDYDPPTDREGFLSLRSDLAVVTGVVYQPRGATAQTLVQNTDYWFHPLNADTDPEPGPGPFRAVEFARGWRWTEPLAPELRRALQVTGRWGYASAIPEDAWWAMLVRAGSLVVPAAGWKLSGGKIRTEAAGASDLYGERPLGWLRRDWLEDFERAVGRYRKVAL